MCDYDVICPGAEPEGSSAAMYMDSKTMAAAVSLINGGYLDEHSVGELARALYVSERQLRRLFARELGVSPLGLARQSRTMRAKELLSETDLTITEVAFASGFGSIRQFNRTFRNMLAAVPSEVARAKGENAV